jgi:hypothetical protein
MKRRLVLVLAVVTLMVAAFSGTALANHPVPGTPGEPNCEGQTTGFLAHASKEQLGEPGIGNLAKANGLSVKEVKEIIRAFCATPPAP